MHAFPKLENTSLPLIQGQCIEAKIKFISFLYENTRFWGFSMQRIPSLENLEVDLVGEAAEVVV